MAAVQLNVAALRASLPRHNKRGGKTHHTLALYAGGVYVNLKGPAGALREAFESSAFFFDEREIFEEADNAREFDYEQLAEDLGGEARKFNPYVALIHARTSLAIPVEFTPYHLLAGLSGAFTIVAFPDLQRLFENFANFSGHYTNPPPGTFRRIVGPRNKVGLLPNIAGAMDKATKLYPGARVYPAYKNEANLARLRNTKRRTNKSSRAWRRL
jgi:hypothetical protein